jgi:hypothetical protein
LNKLIAYIAVMSYISPIPSLLSLLLPHRNRFRHLHSHILKNRQSSPEYNIRVVLAIHSWCGNLQAFWVADRGAFGPCSLNNIAIMYIPTLCATVDVLDAAAQMQLNGTSPWTVISPGWVPEPNTGRGTMDIIWSCLVTIFACSWTVTHPDFPSTKSWQSSKVWWCALAVVAPELMAYTALDELLRVKHHFKVIRKMNKGQWTMSKLFFVNMGGVKLKFEDCTETLGYSDDEESSRVRALINLQRALKLNILGMKSIPAADVEKRAKSDYIIKGLVCLQASWLVVQVIGRAVASLPITTLEVVTVGYVVCALITYGCWWHKPQDAEVQIVINCKRLTKESFHEQIEEIDDEPETERWWKRFLLCVTCGIFGAVHCTAWNFFFPTFVERVMWKVASVLTVVTPLLFILPLLLPVSVLVMYGSSGWDAVPRWVVPSFYVLVRLYLMIEPFVAFRSVPVGIFYTVDWSSWIPHV